KRLFEPGGFDPRLPEANALWKPLAIARSWKQIEKEISISRVKRAQAFGDDRAGARLGLAGCFLGRQGKNLRSAAWGTRHSCQPGSAPSPAEQKILPVAQVLGHLHGGGVAIGRALAHGFEADALELARNR